MPHFVIDCSATVLNQQPPEAIMRAVYITAEMTGLFANDDIKVRINPFTHFLLDEGKEDFIHVFAYIMQGRNTEQKRDLSKQIIITLKGMLPEVPIISINITDFEKATYYNRSMV